MIACEDMPTDAKIDLEKVSFVSTLFTFNFLSGFFFPFLSLFLCRAHSYSLPIFQSERRRNKPTSPAGLPKCHRKDSTTHYTYTGPGRCHCTFRPRCLRATTQPKPTRAGGHCQLVYVLYWTGLVFPSWLF